MKNNKVTKITRLFGMKVKIERIKRNLSQEELAALAGVSRPTIGAIERAENIPSIETAASIAKALNIELDKLFIFDNLE